MVVVERVVLKVITVQVAQVVHQLVAQAATAILLVMALVVQTPHLLIVVQEEVAVQPLPTLVVEMAHQEL